VIRGRAFATSDRLTSSNDGESSSGTQVLAERRGKRIRIATASSSFFEVIGGARHRGCERIVQHRPPDSLCAIRASKANFFKGLRTETPPYQMQFLIGQVVTRR